MQNEPKPHRPEKRYRRPEYNITKQFVESSPEVSPVESSTEYSMPAYDTGNDSPPYHPERRIPIEDDQRSGFSDSESVTGGEEQEALEPSTTLGELLIDYVWTINFALVLLSVILLSLGFYFIRSQITIIQDGGVSRGISLGSCAITVGIGVASAVFLEITLKSISLNLLKRSTGDGSMWFYFHEISTFISWSTVLFILYIFISSYFGNFYFSNSFLINLKLLNFLKITFLFFLLFGSQKCVVKYISSGFNYVTYLRRIKKCLFLDFLVSLLNRIEYFSNSENDNKGDGTDKMDENEILVFGSLRLKRGIATFIFNPKFHYSEKIPLSFAAKRILLKEFEAMNTHSLKFHNTMLTVLNDIKEKSRKRSQRIFQHVQNVRPNMTVADLRRYFRKSRYFNVFLRGTNLREQDQITQSFIQRNIEKIYKEKFLIFNSLSQVNAALERVAASVKLLTIFLYFISIYISATGEFSTVGGIASAIFGTSFIASIINENVVQSIMFLFVIHPYDVGDRVLIRFGGVEENLVVAELNVFSTQFFRWDGTSVFIPNKVLVNSPICNVRRSGAMMETHSIQISHMTHPMKLDELKYHLLEFVRRNSEDYTDYILVNYEKIEDSNKLFIKVLMQYRKNKQNHDKYLGTRSKFIGELNRILHRLQITYELPTQSIVLRKGSVKDHEIGSPSPDWAMKIKTGKSKQ